LRRSHTGSGVTGESSQDTGQDTGIGRVSRA